MAVEPGLVVAAVMDMEPTRIPLRGNNALAAVLFLTLSWGRHGDWSRTRRRRRRRLFVVGAGLGGRSCEEPEEPAAVATPGSIHQTMLLFYRNTFRWSEPVCLSCIVLDRHT